MESGLSAYKPLTIERRFNENEIAPIRQSDVVLSPTIAATSATAVVTAGDAENLRIEYLAVFNGNGSTAASFGVFFVPSGGTATTPDNRVLSPSVPAGGTVVLDALIGAQLAAGESLQMASSLAGDTVVFGRFTRITQGT